jgi:hypothetical protein|nr:MAG TPA: terminase large subunit [Caudoviricetes sp.]
MSLQSLLELSDSRGLKKQGLSEERLKAQLPHLRNLVSFYREYPDYLIDFMKGPDSTFNFYFYQRVFLRIVMRHRYVYATFPRAYSKSFLSMMVLMLRCILYPNSHLFVTTGGKEQAASITIAKIEEICKLIPSLNNEIDWTRGASKKSKDDVKYIFKNGSSIDILAAKQSSRGQRRTGGLMEECVLIDGDILNEVIIPTTNVDRLLPDGTRHKEEVINKSQIYITTAGWKNSFAYDKLIELLIQSVIEPDRVMIMGGTYETPVTEGLLDEDFVDQLKLQGTFKEESFDREYRSLWSGDAENAFYSSEKFDKHRVLLQPEYEYSGRSSKNAYYVLGVDVGRIGCTTEVCVFKVTPQPQGTSLKSLVHIYTYEAEHFEDQAIHIKKLYYKYKARVISIDANGLGIGLVDFMVKSQVDPESGDSLPPFGVEGGTSEDAVEPYKKIKGADVEENALYLIKANAPINTEAYSYAQTQLSSGKIKFLIDESMAKTKLMSTKVGQNMDSDKRNEFLKPFTLTSILREQMLNLVEKNSGVNIILEQSSKSIKKDKFSAFIYGLYYIKQEEDNKRKRRKRHISDFMFMN